MFNELSFVRSDHMALPLRPRTIPQCSACLRTYAFGSTWTAEAATAGFGQQVRGKKKIVNTTSTVPVRLLKNVKTFGKKGKHQCVLALSEGSLIADLGAIVPISVGMMRNTWFPRHIAEYVTLPERRTLRLKNVAIERDFEFGITELAKSAGANTEWQKDVPGDIKSMSDSDLQTSTPLRRKPEVERITPERSAELVEIFVGQRLDFYRQPIIEEKAPEEPPQPPPTPEKRPRGMTGAAMDLLEARTPQPEKPKEKEKEVQAIYGSVSTHDVLVAMRAAMATNDEAARVHLAEGDIKFVNVAAEDEHRVKHVGDFTVEIRPKGAENAVRRSIRVIAQEMER